MILLVDNIVAKEGTESGKLLFLAYFGSLCAFDAQAMHSNVT